MPGNAGGCLWGTTSSVSASRRCHLPKGGRLNLLAANQSPLRETGMQRQWGSFASPSPTHPRMRKQRTTHGRPKSAKVRCLCLAAQHKHFTQDYAIRFTPRVTKNLGVRGGPTTLLSPPGGLLVLFAQTKSTPDKEPTCIQAPPQAGIRAAQQAKRTSPPQGKAPRSAFLHISYVKALKYSQKCDMLYPDHRSCLGSGRRAYGKKREKEAESAPVQGHSEP